MNLASPLTENPANPADTPTAGQDGTKKKKLTIEERKELAKNKKMLKQKQALEQKKQQFRDYLTREQKYTDITYKRAAADWEAMCKNLKQMEMLKDMTELWQSVNRILDNKNNKLNRVLRELDEGEEQYRRNFSKHADILEYLIKLFKLLVDIARKAYEKDATDLFLNFQEDIAEKQDIYKANKTYYENVLHATNLLTANALGNMANRFIVDVNEIKDTHIAKRLQFRDLTVFKMERLQENMEKAVAGLQINALNPKREQIYNQCVERQEQVSKELAAFRETTRCLQTAFSTQQAKLLSSETQANTEVVKLRGKRSYYVKLYWRLKQHHKQSKKSHDDKLKRLALRSYQAISKLKKICKYGELVLSMTAYCRKLQTEKEKVTPWTDKYQCVLPKNTKHTDDSQEQIVDHVRSMHLFWNRVGQAEAHVLCLREEKEMLKRENQNLCQLIKSHGEAQSYKKVICSLRISQLPTSTIPVQEASHMPQIKQEK